MRNQVWIETDTHLVITLHQPFWSAWKQYGWEYRFGIRCEGLGVSVEAIHKAHTLGKKIRVNVLKYGAYEISPELAEQWGEPFLPRDKKPILVIPRIKFVKIPSKEPEREERRKKVIKREVEIRRQLEFPLSPTVKEKE